ncbi:hypothetical protein HYH03_008728 [Edaphochlamys debaryana]|uniref:Uncharacterized protein n=1 Tax=Edaphochlamys debaryana TaxID=47281 RepID=A0A835XZT9_9CHLO|nr:hypothetical protein HYH03_008728 [Edaphochlamys debaryana]|eukprot:KAG2493065.1 hypothetical protein HYH03_008728 [Edaphochlamys debaryana]
MQLTRRCPRVASSGQRQSVRPSTRVHARPEGAMDFKAGLAAVALTAGMLLSSPSMSHAAAVVEEAVEREVMIASEKRQIEYMLQQEENARKAAILAQRKAVEAQVTTVETALQQKLTEQRANVLAAEKQGDQALAKSLRANTEVLEGKQEAVRKAAAQLGSRLDRAEMLAKAKAISDKQQVEKAAKDATDEVAEKVDRYLEKATGLQ